MPLAPGACFGPYEIIALVGAGGMGEVYKARDTRLDRIVAIKVLPESPTDDPQLHARFEREARAISQLTHPHICTLYTDLFAFGAVVYETLAGKAAFEAASQASLIAAILTRAGADHHESAARAASHRSGAEEMSGQGPRSALAERTGPR